LYYLDFQNLKTSLNIIKIIKRLSYNKIFLFKVPTSFELTKWMVKLIGNWGLLYQLVKDFHLMRWV